MTGEGDDEILAALLFYGSEDNYTGDEGDGTGVPAVVEDRGELARGACRMLEKRAAPVAGDTRQGLTEAQENERCPTCGGITDDAAGGPCSLCWRLVEDPPTADEVEAAKRYHEGRWH